MCSYTKTIKIDMVDKYSTNSLMHLKGKGHCEAEISQHQTCLRGVEVKDG
jgi:hypothetical protein